MSPDRLARWKCLVS